MSKYNVQFDMFAPVDVNGPNAHPLFKQINPESKIAWNFDGKFLIDREGNLAARYASRTPAATLDAHIAQLLG